MLLNTYLCYPLPPFIGWYMLASAVMTIVCFDYMKKKQNFSKFSYFLSLFQPFLGVLYLFISKTKSNDKLSTFMLLAWAVIFILPALRRLCF